MTMFGLITAAAVIAVLAAAPGARAQDEERTPRVSDELSIEIENDWTHDSEDPANERNDLYATVEPTIVLHLLAGLTLTAAGTLEPVRDPDPGDDRAFQDHGLYLSDLIVEFERPIHEMNGTSFALAVYGGKFTPGFGMAWDAAPGVFGADFAEDYELSERIGMGARLTAGSATAGTHALSINTYFVDTFLDSSTLASRGTVELADGGVGNTEDLSSFTVTLDGAGIPALPGFAYHLGFVHQAAADRPDLAGMVGVDAERGLAAGLQQTFAAGPDGAFEITPLLEIVHFTDADGTPGQDRTYLTAGIGGAWKNWNAGAVYTNRTTTMSGAPDADDNLFAFSVGYAFEFGLAVDLGYKIAEEADVTSHTLGGVAGYVLEF
jgi:hypothetical protein